MSGAGPADVGFPCLLSCSFVLFSAEAQNSAEPTKGFSSPSRTASERLFAKDASRKVAFYTIQICWSSGSFYHSLVLVAFSPDWSSNFSATAWIHSSCMTSFSCLDFCCAAFIAFMNCGILSASLKSVFITCGILTASTVCSPEQNSLIRSRSLRAVTFV